MHHATVRQMWAAAIAISLGWFCYRIAFVVDCRLAGGGLMTCWRTEPLLPNPKDAGLIAAAASSVFMVDAGASLAWTLHQVYV